MLTILTRKLCPLMSLAIATIGCGKKITEDKAKPSTITQGAEIPSTYVIQIDGSQTSRKNYTLPADTQFEVPERIKIRRGSTTGKAVEIAHNVSIYDNDDYDFKCIYKPSGNPVEMILDKCLDYYDRDFGDVSGQPFTMRKGEIIQMRFTGSSALDVIADAIYSMKWVIEKPK